MRVQISRNLVKFLSIIPHIALNSQENDFEMIKYLVFYGCFTNNHHFKALYKNYDVTTFKAFFLESVSLLMWLYFQKKKLKVDILEQSKKGLNNICGVEAFLK